MGGSSLGPEVIRRSYGEIPDGLRLHVLDSTDPGAVLEVERSVDLDTTLFIVSSKSGGTIETLSHMRYFYERSRRRRQPLRRDHRPGQPAGRPGQRARLPARVRERPRHRRALLGAVLLRARAGRAGGRERRGDAAPLPGGRAELRRSSATRRPTPGSGWASRSASWRCQGRDKAHVRRRPEPIESFGLWVEQLIAESTGKQGKGILPVAGEPLGEPESYGDDRVFVYLRDPAEPDAELDAGMEALARAGPPDDHARGRTAPPTSGRIFFFAEFAVAVAGWVLGINPFDQPNVQEAKDNTAKVLAAGELPEVDPGDPEELLAQAGPPHYVAIMGYVKPSEEFDAAIAELRTRIRDHTKATTTFGYGPRFLHSTGQFHKGGPPTGLFLAAVHDGDEDVEIPEAGYGFRHLKNAQAIGDLQTLRDHGLPAVQVRLEGDPADAVRRLP